jgi:hypothetical protein
MKKLPLSLLAASAALLSLHSASAAMVVLDPFSDAAFFPLSVNSVFTFDSSLTGPPVIGSSFATLRRQVDLAFLGSVIPGSSAKAEVVGGIFSLATDTAVTAKATITWTQLGGVPFDFTPYGSPSSVLFSMDVLADLSSGTTPYTFEIFDGINTAVYTPTIVPGGVAFSTVSSTLSAFSGSALIDWSSIDSFKLIIAPKPGGDAFVDILGFTPSPVPEVSTAVSAGAFALVGGIVMLRARKKASVA